MAGDRRLPYTPPNGFTGPDLPKHQAEMVKYLDRLVRQIELALNEVSSNGGAGNFSSTQANVIFEGGGFPLAAGADVTVTAPYNCNILSWTLLGDVSGSAVVDVQTDTYANYPPDGSDSIVGSGAPTLSGAIKGQGTTTGWTKTSFVKDEVIRFVLDSASTLTQLTLVLTLTRT